ncbi:sugar ABC transporter ATP-binding protein [Pseudovibrio ascidiaceicola]|uniref:sugar ABC transporter ATP-binding protein n=1 Tax=Pseudovibrio ascidiaceicola TaxID=285279 RepID=UPI0015F2C4BE|nr:sugar ABC transporter ATP-binding protein [Pseudovibrio ascidiaceicola]
MSLSTQEAVRENKGAAAQQKYLLEVDSVRKEFPGVVALDDVNLRIRPGTVHALMGENGAGKSTLMKIIAGIYQPDRGEVRLGGKQVHMATPLDALEQGVAMIHQELNLMPFMTIAENIWIRREPFTKLGFVDHKALRENTKKLFDRLNINLDPETEVRDLSIANRQMVEIAKAISYESDVLIMDEPTSALTDREVEHLFQIIASLKADGKGIVYITHKMDEVFEIADDVSVFRDGKYIGTDLASNLDSDQLIRMMVGREITQMFPKEEVPIGDVVLSVKDLCLDGVFENVNFELRAGEILGVAGLVGSGRTNVAETIYGVTPATGGSITVFGETVEIKTPAEAMGHGMALLTEDRKDTGLFLMLDIQENMQIALLSQDHVKAGFVAESAVSKLCTEMSNALRVKTPGMNERIENLSGGNQQKVLIGRWLLTKPRILILDEPTRGIDVGAKAEIHKLITKLAGEGVAVLMISSEMPEVLGMSDRVMVMHEGHVTGILDRAEADQVSVMRLASN